MLKSSSTLGLRLGLLENTELAMQYLMQSFDLDPECSDLVAHEEDFGAICDDPDFQRLTSVIV